MAALEPGDPRHIGRYRLLRRLGEGGMGLVYLGASPAGRAVAIKVVRPQLAGDEKFRARFGAEVEAAQKVSGAFTSPVVDADLDGPVPWLATAYVNGLSLKETIERHGPMPESLLRTLAAGLGEALIAIHRAGVLHRDLKPGNILLAKDGPRVIDFGISKAADRATLTSEGRFIGSPGYMSPEQIRGTRLTTAADVFAFGAVLAFAATGRPPYGREAIPTIVHRTLHQAPDLHGVPDSLERMVAACLSRDPAGRPPATLLPSLLTAPPVTPGWLPDAIGQELRQREENLVLELRTLARARTRRRLLTGGAAVAGLAAVGGGTAAALAGGERRRIASPKLLWRSAIEDADATPDVLSRTIICSGRAGVYRCYSLATGKQIWSREFADATIGSTVFYAAASSGDSLVALDETPTVKWTYRPPTRFQNPYLQGPANGVLVLTDQNNMIVGLSAATGRQLWIHQWPARTSLVFLYGIQGRNLLAWGIQDADGRHPKSSQQLIALDTATGTVRWSHEGGTAVVPPGNGNLVFANPSHTTLDALSIDTGQKAWSADLRGAAANPGHDSELSAQYTVANGLVYTGGPTIYALDAATGRPRWTYTPTSPGGQERTLLIKGRYAYILDNPQLIALDARTGRRLWSVNTPATGTAPLVAVGGLICTGVAGNTGTGLYGWNAETGKLVWSHPTAATDPTNQWALDTRGPILAAAHGNALLAFHLG